MSNGLFAAAAGLAAQQTRLDSIASDLSNVNTTGYKHERLAFRELLGGNDRGLEVGGGAAAVPIGRSFAQGSLRQTGEPLDVAIDGAGFLRIRLADGRDGLTRDGSLHVDARGSLVTASGARLEPPVTLPAGTDPSTVSIARDGTISAGGRELGRIELVDVPVPSALEPAGDNVFVPTRGSGAPRAAAGKLEQGFLEASNVDMTSAMTELLEAQRAYDLASRAVRTQDQLLEIANGIRR